MREKYKKVGMLLAATALMGVGTGYGLPDRPEPARAERKFTDKEISRKRRAEEEVMRRAEEKRKRKAESK